jgi:hypothetical protein
MVEPGCIDVGWWWTVQDNEFVIVNHDSELTDYKYYVLNATKNSIEETAYDTLAELYEYEGLEGLNIQPPRFPNKLYEWKIWIDLNIKGDALTEVQSFLATSADSLPHPFKKSAATVACVKNTVRYLEANGFRIAQIQRRKIAHWEQVKTDDL